MSLAPSAGCGGDPYSRYGAVVHEDVDAAIVAAFQMSARLQLTVVHNRIPAESLAVVAGIMARTARGVREKATHFAAVTPPPDLERPHAHLSVALARLAHALEATASAFQGCADPSGAGDSMRTACPAELATVSSRFAYVGEDLSGARNRVQRALLPHGVLLRAVISTRARVPPTFVDPTPRRTG